ncbi:major facilitator superfamily protein [Hirsutella rhossiliensis]
MAATKDNGLVDLDDIQPLDSRGMKKPSRVLQPPEMIRSMGAQQRSALEKKLIRKIDFRLLPMILMMYILNYIDRTNIALARLAGLEEDLKLDQNGSQFETAVSILFVGYILMQVPSNLILNKTGKPGKYLPACPGCLYYLSCWYTRSELSLRTAYLFVGALLGGAFSGLIAAGITNNMDGTSGLRAWRWLFLVEGVATVAVAFAAFFVLPDFPRTTGWLNEQEAALAAWRLEEDIGQDDWINAEDQTLWHGFKLALEDVKTWILLVLLFGQISANSVTNFFPTVVATLHYGPVPTLLLTVPPYVLGLITTLANAWHADKTGERFYHITLPLGVGIAAFIVAAATTNTAARYVSMMLMIPGLYSGFTTAVAWVSNTMPRPPAKRAAALAVINAVGNGSSIYTSFLYPASAKPRYIGAFIHNSMLAAMAIAAAFVLKVLLLRLNRKLDRGETVKGAINAAPGEAVERGFRFLV